MRRHEPTSGGASSPPDTPRREAVSVVIPVYNKEPYLADTIDSVLSQTRLPEEIVVVDDGSTDESARIAASYGPRIRLLQQANAGESSARNRGIEESTGEWIALLDGDDVWEPEKLERQLAAVGAAGDEPICVYTDVYLFDDSGARIGEHRKPEYHAEDDWHVQMLCAWSINPSTVLIRRSGLGDLRFPMEVRHSEDMIFLVELRAQGSFLKLHETLVGYRRNQDNQTASPRHHLDSVASRWQWFLDNEHKYDENDKAQVRLCLARQLLPTFSLARFTTRDVGLAKECQRLYREIHPDPTGGNRSMRSRIYPEWTYRLWDHLRGATRGS